MLTFAAIIIRRGLGLFLISVTGVFGLFSLLPFLAPALAAIGYDQLARAIFVGFSVACHQIPERSFFLFGHQLAVCQREVGIYVGLFASSLVYRHVQERLGPMPIRLYFIAISPMIIDGLSQMLGMRESDWLLRVTTGALFGVSTVWVFFPRLAQTLSDIDAHLSNELKQPRRSLARFY